jgi:HAD superfamily hydrolase (TIGR01490 family)
VLALFDIDGTLVTGPSTERRLFRALLAAGHLGPRQLAAFAAFVPRQLPAFGRHVLRKNKAYLAGLVPAELAAFADQWVPGALAGAWFAPAVARLRGHLAAGDEVVLLSGTPDFVARAIARELGAPAWLGSWLAVQAGRFTAAPPARHPFGAAKLELARELCRARGLALADVAAYGDSVHDLPLLAAVGKPVAVRPDGALARAARHRRWDVVAVAG